MAGSSFISIRGCRLHNLKNVDAQFPLGGVTVVCGPSGCGKSTLVLDTLHGESKRRYLETLSPFAAELLGGRRIVPLDSAEGLPASLAIGASHGETPAKSYALSLSECDGTMRSLFARFAKPACPVCGKPMESTSREEIIREIAGLPQGSKLQFFAPVDNGGKEPRRTKASLDKLSAVFLAQGFTRAMADGVVYSLADLTDAERKIVPQEFFIVVDRVIVRENTRTRIAEAVDGVLKLTHGELILDNGGKRTLYSTVPRCPDHGAGQTRPLEPEDLSPYSRACACPECSGTGSIEPEGAGHDTGDRSEEECPVCNGFRLRQNILNATIGDTTWKDILETPFTSLEKKVRDLFGGRILANQKPAFNALIDRIQAINELGIGYLTAGRAGYSLSGGEIQRLRLSSLSTGHLNGLLIVLDEPASGLHACDVEALWKVLKKVQSRGNTLVLIEHNPLIIKKADWVIEMGPGAGEKGGEILFQGTAKDVLENPQSPTGMWIKGLDEKGRSPHKAGMTTKAPGMTTQATKATASKSRNKAAGISVKDFAMFDMKPVSADFPVQKFSVITGQSGSGKSTLLFRNIATRASAGEFERFGIQAFSILSTGDFHGNRRSTVASAINLNTQLRDLFAKLPESKVRGYTASKFATHAPGGRCENCKGEGVLYDGAGYEETECPVCLGRRFKDEILEVRFKSLSIADVLDLEISEACKIFANLKPFVDKLKPLADTGLGYLRLGQTTAHLSGGERARLRLSIALARAKAPNTLFLFDEPARGLHKKDIEHLLALIHGLTEAGHTVIAIEHAQDFVNDADYVLELSR
ncbi:ATP-binding cassette domain-containing protein [Fibrobacter sp. UWR2]|uniref:ATP-binding cassette domain-containing protein n=1 Tax=Fibrobacter sp. UWR2 TaxID=1964352 RepID=UPI000B51E962|nr:ATP-binding cassette domain-containing protein [Fibrobacter sp. UWR2]OWV02386.1 ABC transporter [Fibrobacter sp. UWR2]